MNPLLARQIDEVVGTRAPDRERRLACETPLRVAAAMLSRAHSTDVTATSVVATLGPDDLDAVEDLVSDIAAEYGLDSRMRVNIGSVSVRFSR